MILWIGSYYGIRQIDRRTKREEPMGFEYLFYNHPVNDLELNKYGVWIASRTGIYVYDKDNPQIMNALSIGISYLDFPISRVTSIFQRKNILMYDEIKRNDFLLLRYLSYHIFKLIVKNCTYIKFFIIKFLNY